MARSVQEQEPEKAAFERLRSQASFLRHTGRNEEAIEYAKKALAISPDDPWPYVQIAYALADKNGVEAVEWMRRAIQKDPNTAQWRGALAEIYSHQRKWTESLEPGREAISMDPEDSRFPSILGHSLMHLGKFKEAIPLLEAALRLDPNNANDHQRLSIALLKTGNDKGSESHLQRALELDPDDPILKTYRGWRFLLAGRRREATEAFQEALRINPEREGPKVGLGTIKLSKKEISKGIADIVFQTSLGLYLLPHRRVVLSILVLGALALAGLVVLDVLFYQKFLTLTIAAEVALLALTVSFAGVRRIVKIISWRKSLHSF